MASRATFRVTITTQRGHTTYHLKSGGRSVSFTTAGYQRDLFQQPMLPTTSLNAYWLAALNNVVAALTGNPNPP